MLGHPEMSMCRGLGSGAFIALWVSLVILSGFSHAASPIFSDSQVISDAIDVPLNALCTDLDGDSSVDLVVTQGWSSNALLWFESVNGDWASAEPTALVRELRSIWNVDIADVDGDDDPDLLSAHIGTEDLVAWHENISTDPASFETHAISLTANPAVEGSRSVAGADLDGDGDCDVASASDSTGFFGWHENTTGDGASWERHSLGTLAGSFGLTAVDLDGDGDLDLLSAAKSSGVVSWWQNDGEGNFTCRAISNAEWMVRNVVAGDLDGDGDLDVVTNASTAGVVWHENIGGEPFVWNRHPILLLGGVHDASIALADLDADGDLDLVAGTTQPGSVTWFENSGGLSPDFAPHTLISPQSLNGYYGVPGDLDRDGDIDIVVTQHTEGLHGGAVLWFENTLAQVEILSAILQADADDDIHLPGGTGTLQVEIRNPGPIGLTEVAVAASAGDSPLAFDEPLQVVPLLASGESLTLAFPYTVNSDAPCGSLLTADVEVDWRGGVATANAQASVVGVQTTRHHLGVDVARQPIPDGDPEGVSRCYRINAPGMVVNSLRFQVAIRHPNREDLLVTLTAPSGESILLWPDGQGEDGENLLATWQIDEAQGIAADGVYMLTVVDAVETPDRDFPHGFLETAAIDVELLGHFGCGETMEDILGVLLGEDPPLIWQDINGDGMVDAADLTVTVLRER